jgi:AraC-like DNA-binding protein
VREGASELERTTLASETLLALVGAPAPTRAPRAVQRAREYLRGALARPVSLDELARHVAHDKFHLARAFRAHVGLPPYAYLTQLRVARARELLRAGASPAQAAASVGFCDESQLHRHFRRIVGVTPGVYAASVRARSTVLPTLPKARRRERAMIACPELDHHAHPPATVRLGDLVLRRMGYGAMRLPGPDVWGEPEDAAAARTVLRRAVDLGVQLIDTAWFYGPMVANRLIAEALHPYPADLVIATKLGSSRGPDRSWVPALRPEALRDAIEHDLRSLRRERLDLVHLRWMTASPVPLAEALDCLIALQSEGKLRHIGLSMLPIPGTRSLAHLEQNWAARRIALTPEQFEALRGAAAQT